MGKTSESESGQDLNAELANSSVPANSSATGPALGLHSQELQSVNVLHAYPGTALPQSDGLLGKFQNKLRSWLLGEYFQKEQEFNAHLVRHLNGLSGALEQSLARLEDRREGGRFAIERKLATELEGLRRELQTHSGEQGRKEALLEERVKTLESVVRGAERLLATLRPVDSSGVGSSGDALGSVPSLTADPRYVLLENRFRGSEEEISRRLEIYCPVFAGATLPVFELGAGRGELQLLFRKSGISSFAVEQDAAMFERCRDLKLDIRLGDGIAYLETLPDCSLGGFIAVQVVEHLPFLVLKSLFEALRRKVAPGGKIVLETINSSSLMALTSNYFRDPTHVAPLHPQTLAFLLEMSGLEVLETKFLSPYPEGAKLQEINMDLPLTPLWGELLQTMNRNVRSLNELLYGYQDYCVIAGV